MEQVDMELDNGSEQVDMEYDGKHSTRICSHKTPNIMPRHLRVWGLGFGG